MIDIEVVSSLDGSKEPALLYYPEGKTEVPLLVGLHTWSYGRLNQIDAMFPYCRELGWALLLPEFRGPNLNTNTRAIEACGSTLARQDIIDAVEYVTANYSIDSGKIMVLGGSGGGHMALMMAAYKPELWAACSSWCPITDLEKWYQQGQYGTHLEAVCGGKPGDSVDVDQQYRERSPITYAESIAKVNTSVHHGRFDSCVSYSHTMELIGAVEACKPDRFFFEVFEGGHELIYPLAFEWLNRQITDEDCNNNELTS